MLQRQATPATWTWTTWAWIGVTALAAYAFLFGLGRYALLDNNEGLYAEIAREMLRGDALIVPHLNGVPYIEKPPLLYWLTALAYAGFGMNEFAARWPVALAGFATCIMTGIFVRRVSPGAAGPVAATVLASSVAFVALSRTIIFDGLLTLSVTAATFSFFLWHRERRLLWIRLCYLAIGLGVMTKGPVGAVLVAITVLPFAAYTKSLWLSVRAFLDPLGIAILAIVVVPWHGAATIENPDFFQTYVLHEHVGRFFGTREPRDYHTGGMLYYLPRIAVSLFPWTLFAVALLRHSPRNDNLNVLCWAWIASHILLFSLSFNKANYYAITICPALAILLGLKLEEFCRQRRCLALQIFAGASLLALAVAAAVVAGSCKGGWRTCEAVDDLPTRILFGMAASVLVLAIVLTPRLPVVAIIGVAFTIVPTISAALRALESDTARHSQKGVVQALNRISPGQPIAIFRDFEQLSSLAFYSGERIPVIESRSADLLFGSRDPAAKGWFPSAVEFSALAQTRPFFVVVRPRYADLFLAGQSNGTWCAVVGSSRVVAYSNVAAQCSKPALIE